MYFRSNNKNAFVMQSTVGMKKESRLWFFRLWQPLLGFDDINPTTMRGTPDFTFPKSNFDAFKILTISNFRNGKVQARICISYQDFEWHASVPKKNAKFYLLFWLMNFRFLFFVNSRFFIRLTIQIIFWSVPLLVGLYGGVLVSYICWFECICLAALANVSDWPLPTHLR